MSIKTKSQNNNTIHINKISEYLEKNKVQRVSEHFISSHIKNLYNYSLTPKENYKIIIREIIKERILSKRRNIIVHSCIYYTFNMSIIKDFEYDQLCKELAYLQDRFPKISQEAPLYKFFQDWDENTTTGFNLPISNPKVIERAKRIINLNEWYNNG